MSKGHKVFTYGTLMRWHYNHHIIEGARFIAPAKLVQPAFMFDGAFPRFASLGQLDKFPMLRKAAERFTGRVAGELFKVDSAMLERMDRLEGTPHHYTRERMEVELDDGRKTNAFVYRIVDPARYFKFLKPVPPVDGVVCWTGPDYARK